MHKDRPLMLSILATTVVLAAGSALTWRSAAAPPAGGVTEPTNPTAPQAPVPGGPGFYA